MGLKLTLATRARHSGRHRPSAAVAYAQQAPAPAGGSRPGAPAGPGRAAPARTTPPNRRPVRGRADQRQRDAPAEQHQPNFRPSGPDPRARWTLRTCAFDQTVWAEGLDHPGACSSCPMAVVW